MHKRIANGFSKNLKRSSCSSVLSFCKIKLLCCIKYEVYPTFPTGEVYNINKRLEQTFRNKLANLAGLPGRGLDPRLGGILVATNWVRERLAFLLHVFFLSYLLVLSPWFSPFIKRKKKTRLAHY